MQIYGALLRICLLAKKDIFILQRQLFTHNVVYFWRKKLEVFFDFILLKVLTEYKSILLGSLEWIVRENLEAMNINSFCKKYGIKIELISRRTP